MRGELLARLPGELLARFPGELLARFPGELLARFPGELLARFPGELLARFQEPVWLELGGAVAAGAALALLAARWRARRRGERLLGARAPLPYPGRDLALLAALLLIAAALAGPRVGTRVVRAPAGGVDVVLLLDASRSMDARDTLPSRMRRARRAASEILAALSPGDRAALAAFRGRGVLLAPLTRDRSALREMLTAVDTDLFERGGSSLGAGLSAALTAFGEPDPAAPRPRVVLVLGDGEDPSPTAPSPGALVRPLLRGGVRVVGVSLGSAEGASIPDGDGWLADRHGRPVVTRSDPGALASLARATDGRAFTADPWGEVDAEAVAAAVRRDAGAREGDTVERRVAAVRAAPLVLAAGVLLTLDAALRSRRRRGRGLALATAAALTLAAASGDEAPPSARVLVATGLARAEAGDAPGAEHAFRAAAVTARDPALAALAWFDLGVLALARDDLEAARDAFLEAVALAPDDGEALFNLEWTLTALASRPPPAQPPPRPEPSPTPPTPERAPSSPNERRGPPSTDGPARPPTPELSPAEAARWLESARDDAARALRSAIRSGRRPPRRSAEPDW